MRDISEIRIIFVLQINCTKNSERSLQNVNKNCMYMHPVHCTKLTLIQPTWSAYPYHLVFLIWYPYSLVSLIWYPHSLVFLICYCCPNIWTSRPLFWIGRCYGLLWTLYFLKCPYCDVTMIRLLLFNGIRADLSGSPGAAIVGRQSINYFVSKWSVPYFREIYIYN